MLIDEQGKHGTKGLRINWLRFVFIHELFPRFDASNFHKLVNESS